MPYRLTEPSRRHPAGPRPLPRLRRARLGRRLGRRDGRASSSAASRTPPTSPSSPRPRWRSRRHCSTCSSRRTASRGCRCSSCSTPASRWVRRTAGTTTTSPRTATPGATRCPGSTKTRASTSTVPASPSSTRAGRPRWFRTCKSSPRPANRGTECPPSACGACGRDMRARPSTPTPGPGTRSASLARPTRAATSTSAWAPGDHWEVADAGRPAPHPLRRTRRVGSP